MENLQQMLDSDMGDVIAWLEVNSDKFYLVPKDFMTDSDKELLIDSVEAVVDGAPRGEIYDELDFIEDVMSAVYNVVKGE